MKAGDAGPTFRIGTMMLVIAGVAVVLAVVINAPGLAALLAIPSAIALARTLAGPVGPGGRRATKLDYVITFFATFAAVCLVFASAVAAFFGTCAVIVGLPPAAAREQWIGAGLACGAIAGIAAPILVVVGLSRLGRAARPRGAESKREIPE